MCSLDPRPVLLPQGPVLSQASCPSSEPHHLQLCVLVSFVHVIQKCDRPHLLPWCLPARVSWRNAENTYSY